MDSLMTTKIRVPPQRSHIVPRPRLVQKMEDDWARRRRLTLVSAPAGFGKTTLLAEWIRSGGHPCGWVSLEAADNSLQKFWGYAISSLQALKPEIGARALAMLKPAGPGEGSSPIPMEVILADWLNEITAEKEDFLLVLDDLHWIDRESVCQSLAFLLDHSPENFHLVLATRVDPMLPLARLRARNEITEIRESDLRFSLSETSAFLKNTMGLNLAESGIEALESRTEGWIAGLQMAALSMQGRKDTAGFVSAFTGSNRFILDYLLEEVLARESQEVRKFLLHSSILPMLCGPLCDAVHESAPGSSQATLEYLEKANLFVFPIDEERRWYRCHGLFADLLLTQLRALEPEKIPELHVRASKWFEQSRMLPDAVRQAWAAGDPPRAADLLEKNAFALLEQADIPEIKGWMAGLPPDVFRSRPWLCILRATVLLLEGRMADIDAALGQAEIITADFADGKSEEARHLLGYVHSIRAHAAFLRGAIPETVNYANRALAELPDSERNMRTSTGLMLSSAYIFLGDFPTAIRMYSDIRSDGIREGNLSLAAFASFGLARLKVIQGKLRAGLEIYRAALELVGNTRQFIPAIGYIYTGLADLYREWNDLPAAEAYAGKAVAKCNEWGQAEIAMSAYTTLAGVQLSQGNFAAGLAAIREASQRSRDVATFSTAFLLAMQARIWLAQGNLEAASQWASASGLSIQGPAGFPQENLFFVLARVWIAQGKHEEAVSLLNRILPDAETAGRMGNVIEGTVLLAKACSVKGDAPNALETFRRALALAEDEGFIRAFVDEGEPIRLLLTEIVRQPGAAHIPYARKLLEAYGESPVKGAAEASAGLLSGREIDVLRLISAGSTNQQIAEALCISLNTVKSHTKSIYHKLDASNRTRAINRAKELHIL
jgi:LuxR family maltose regulon positive regulatory protein